MHGGVYRVDIGEDRRQDAMLTRSTMLDAVGDEFRQGALLR